MVTMTSVHTLDADQINAVVARYYKGKGVPVSAGYVTHQVHGGSSGGFSSSGPSYGETRIGFPAGNRPVGMPDSMTLREEQLKEILALFFTEALDMQASAGRVTINVSGGGGSGFSSRGPHLQSATFRVTTTID